MAKARMGVGLVAGCLLLGGAAPAWAQGVTVAQLLAVQPKQQGIACTTPTPAEYASCQVKLIRGSQPGSTGYLLLDSAGKPIRRFFDSNGDRQIDIWSYYKDGIEIYRELDSKFANRPDLPAMKRARPDQFRWLGTAGMKWGIDLNDDGKIDGWKLISAEEAAQEAFQAVLGHDFARLQALFISEAEMTALKLPAEQVERLRSLQKQAPATFQATADKLTALGGQPQIVQIESAVPQCIAADVAGTERDLFKLRTRSVLFEYGDKKQEWLQTGRMMQVGLAWRLLEAPVLGNLPGSDTDNAVQQNPELQKLLEALTDLDKMAPQTPPTPRPTPEVVRYNLKRVELLRQIVAKVKESEKEGWIRQLADNLSAAALHSPAGDKSSMTQLQELKDRTVRTAAGSNLAGYVTYRQLWTEYSPVISTSAKVQAEWLEKLAGFVQTYPRADDTPDALFQLGMGCEFAGKDDEAKRWYKQLVGNFPDHALARKADGAARRLDLVGKEMALSGKTATGTFFDISSLKGKVVAVYYWASYGETVDRDFARLKELQGRLAGKGLEVVTVNLDDQPADAMKVLQKASFPGAHLVQPVAENSGLNSPLATQYGIMGVPTLFLVGKDGKVINRTLHVGDLEDAVQKAL
jgi:thiol-disulfide isomerase/thioredoxin